MPPVRRRAGAMLAAALLAAAVVPAAAPALPTLHHGDRGRSVERLQHALHVRADGVFGRGTVRAVRRFQRRHGLHADGVVGAGTWRMLRRSVHRRHAAVRTSGRVTGRGGPAGAVRSACSSAASALPPTASSVPAPRGR